MMFPRGRLLTSVLQKSGGYGPEQTLTLQSPGATVIDSQIFSSAPTTNYGTNILIQIGEPNDVASDPRRGLIKFDLSGVPANALLTSVILKFYCLTDKSDNARTYRVYRIKRAWTEAGVTWNTYDGTNNWTTAGGFDVADCEQTDIGSRDFTATETLNEFKSIVLTPTTKAALDLGNGWLIKPDTESDDGYRFASSNNATAANRPILEVKYRVPL